ncbi:MAG: hypothetical protein ACLFU9_01010 [Candidatus Bathyarchaeia archaeon]
MRLCKVSISTFPFVCSSPPHYFLFPANDEGHAPIRRPKRHHGYASKHTSIRRPPTLKKITFVGCRNETVEEPEKAFYRKFKNVV